MNVRTPLLTLVLGLALATGGCGGDDVSSAEPELGTKKAAWADAAGARCLEYQEAALKVRERFSDPKLEPDEAIQGSLREGLTLLRGMITDLRALDVPGDVKDEWSTFVDGYQQIADAMPDLADEQASGTETQEMRDLFSSVGKKVGPVAEKYDLGACSKVIGG